MNGNNGANAKKLKLNLKQYNSNMKTKSPQPKPKKLPVIPFSSAILLTSDFDTNSKPKKIIHPLPSDKKMDQAIIDIMRDNLSVGPDEESRIICNVFETSRLLRCYIKKITGNNPNKYID